MTATRTWKAAGQPAPAIAKGTSAKKKTLLGWMSETLVKLALVAGIISALWTVFIDTNPDELVANISVVIDNAVTITEEAKEFPLTRGDAELLRAW